MSTKIFTMTENGPGVASSSQRHLDRTSKGVLWSMSAVTTLGALRFHRSTDNGATWSEDVAARVTGIKPVASASMMICTESSSRNAIVAVNVSEASDYIRFHFGRFEDDTTRIVWKLHDVIAGAGKDPTWRFPTAWITPTGDDWVVHLLWSQLAQSSTKSKLWYKRTRLSSGGAILDEGGGAISVHGRPSSGHHVHPVVASRHLGDDDVRDDSNDLYVGWAHGLPADPSRTYMARIPADGATWDTSGFSSGNRRQVNDLAGVEHRLISGCYTGYRFAVACVPNDVVTQIDMYLMTPTDISFPTKITAPALGDGNIVGLTATWDSKTGDVYIVAVGATSRTPRFVVYNWATRTFGSWNQVNTDQVADDSLSSKPGSRGSRVEIVYGVDVGTDREFRYALVTASNVAPSQPQWVSADGASDPAVALSHTWSHIDVDDDPQASFEVRRTVDAGSFEYWNGSGWQATAVSLSSQSSTFTEPAGWATDGQNLLFYVRTNDGQAWSPWSSARAVDARSAPTLAVVRPVNGDVLTDPDISVDWVVSDQRSYRLDILTSDGTSVVDSTGWVPQSATRTHKPTYPFNSGDNYVFDLQVRSTAGVEVSQQVAVSMAWQSPPRPTATFQPFTTVDGSPVGFEVAVTNPVPVGSEPDAASNIVVRVDVATEEETRIAVIAPNATFRDYAVASGQDVDYVIIAVTDDGRSSRSDLLRGNLLTSAQADLEPVDAAAQWAAHADAQAVRSTSTPLQGSASLRVTRTVDGVEMGADTLPVSVASVDGQVRGVATVSGVEVPVEARVRVVQYDDQGALVHEATGEWIAQQEVPDSPDPGGVDPPVVTYVLEHTAAGGSVWTNPNGATLDGRFTFRVTPSTDAARVEWAVDGVTKLIDTAQPFQVTLDSADYPDGPATVSATVTRTSTLQETLSASVTWSTTVVVPGETDPVDTASGIDFATYDYVLTPGGYGTVRVGGGSPQNLQSHRNSIGSGSSVRYLVRGILRGCSLKQLNANDLIMGDPVVGGAMTHAQDITSGGWTQVGSDWRKTISFTIGQKNTSQKGVGGATHGVLEQGGNLRHGWSEALYFNNNAVEAEPVSSRSALGSGKWFLDENGAGGGQHYIWIRDNPGTRQRIELARLNPEGYFWCLRGRHLNAANMVFDMGPTWSFRSFVGGDLGPRDPSASPDDNINVDGSVRYCTIRRCSASGFRPGDGMLTEHTLIERNGQLGYQSWAANTSRKGSRAQTWRYCRIRRNGVRDYESGTAAGAGKRGQGSQSGFLYENCDLSENEGKGFWADYDPIGGASTPWGLLVSCRMRGNYDHGYLLEGSDAGYNSTYSLSGGAVSDAGHGLFVGAAVQFRGSRPNEVSEWRPYFVVARTSGTFTISAKPGGTALNLTGSSGGTVRGVNAAVWCESYGNGWVDNNGRNGFQLVLSNSRRGGFWQCAANRTDPADSRYRGNGGLGMHNEGRNLGLTGAFALDNRVSSNGGSWGKKTFEMDTAGSSTSYTGSDLKVDDNDYFGDASFRRDPNNYTFAGWKNLSSGNGNYDATGSSSGASTRATLPSGAVGYTDNFWAGALVDPYGGYGL